MPQQQLTINDAKLMINIIDVSSQKGVFTGENLIIVGTLFQKLKNIIDVNENDSSSLESLKKENN